MEARLVPRLDNFCPLKLDMGFDENTLARVLRYFERVFVAPFIFQLLPKLKSCIGIRIAIQSSKLIYN